MSISKFQMELAPGKTCWVEIFNLKDGEKRDANFRMLAEYASDGDKYDTRVVACGGDGTVKWVISCLQDVGALNVPIGVIPFGTGNDLSRVMGWGAKPPSPLIGTGMSALRDRIRMIYEADQIPLDVWVCTVHLRSDGEGGFFEEVKDKKIVRTHSGKQSVSQPMINYFSLGADGELMFAFEQNRRSSQLGNKLLYLRKGMRQTLSPPNRLDKFIQGAHERSTAGDSAEDQTLDQLDLDERDRMLLFLNIPSYGAGSDPWRRRKDGKDGSKFHPQFVGDEKLEILSMRSTSNAGLALATGSTLGIKRIKQGRSFHIKLKPGSSVFFQVDGEALKANNADMVEVEHGYQVQLLRSAEGKAVAYPDGFIPRTPSAALREDEVVLAAHDAIEAEDAVFVVSDKKEESEQAKEEEVSTAKEATNEEEVSAAKEATKEEVSTEEEATKEEVSTEEEATKEEVSTEEEATKEEPVEVRKNANSDATLVDEDDVVVKTQEDNKSEPQAAVVEKSS
mmetsp:Transcript_33676/g.54039  ORF Transcript_33676/g.54039 Transcript_33676/m.54039 type:complete len:508 (+) Transcript_33676:189-1712(+)